MNCRADVSNDFVRFIRHGDKDLSCYAATFYDLVIWACDEMFVERIHEWHKNGLLDHLPFGFKVQVEE